ncbi:MAG: ABC transporter permease [Aestuariivirga sp.]
MSVIRSRSAAMLLAPAILAIAVFMALPLLLALAVSFMTADPYGGAHTPLTSSAYVQLLFQEGFDGQWAYSADYLQIFVRSTLLAIATTIVTLAVALPVAWHIVCQRPEVRSLMLFAVTLPFWTNLLIRTYCWVLILRDHGLVNELLVGTGVVSSPIALLYNNGAVLLGLVYSFLPFMVLPIYSTLERMDTRLIEASHDLYAGRIQTLRNVVWPAAKPGAAAGAILVFAPALGSFIAPDLLGGGKVMLIGNLIQNQFSSARNWPFGAAVAILLTVAVLAAIWMQTKRESRRGDERA